MASAQTLVDHDAIKEWAESRMAKPACVKGTGGRDDAGMIRLDFPGFGDGDSLQEITWEEWFRQFDENGLALIVQEKTASGERSHFNKLVKRDETEPAGQGRAKGASHGRA
jgi:hypothetical protein